MGKNDQAIPIAVELIPDHPIELTAMCQANDVSCRQFRVKCPEVTKFAGDRAGSSADRNRKLTDERVSGSNASERHSTIQLDRENQFLASP